VPCEGELTVSDELIDPDNDDHVRLSVDDAQALGEQALVSLGFTAEHARITALHLVDAALSGYDFAGLPRILIMADRPEMKEPCTPITIVKETPVSALVDGGNHVGYIAISHAADIGVEKARTSGIGLIGMRNSWFGGRATHYLEKISRAGFAAIYAVSSTPTVVPPGAMQKALGTNPLAFALPGKPDPFIFDMGTSSVMSGEVLMKAFLGEGFSEVCGIDKQGEPTRNASAMLEGGVFPFGGHKGYGLSLAVQALGLLAGSRFRNGDVTDFGYFIMVFDPALFMPAEQFEEELAELIAKIKGLPKQPGIEEIRIPSERGFREREIRRKQGVLLSKRVHERLLEMT
jgi:LDH2 family malate/lactate/ureidoglycolate dehydrogenase